MNYLAHIFLAGDTAESIIGNLAGDFVKGPLPGPWEPEIARGIMEHRKIDAFTDAHPSVGSFRRIIAEEHGHYARVIADVFFDHFLATHWNDYCAQPLDQFLRDVFVRLDPHTSLMPPRLRDVYPRMRDGRWFHSYSTLEGIGTALYYLSRRFSRRPQLEPATRLLVDRRTDLERNFRLFFPEVIAFAKALRSQQ